jgi:hypothetical protein
MKMKFMAATAALLMATAAQAATVDFETETQGAKPNGYTVGGITFNDTLGANLDVMNYGVQGVGTRSLAVNGDDASALEMIFSGTSTNLSLIFGNDDPGFTTAGDLAVLRIFMGATQVGITTLVMNRDDIANQTISSGLGIAFNRATFVYANASLTPINLIEVVDNITYTVGGAVPEPATWGLMLAGFGIVGGAMRRRQRTSVSFA